MKSEGDFMQSLALVGCVERHGEKSLLPGNGLGEVWSLYVCATLLFSLD